MSDEKCKCMSPRDMGCLDTSYEGTCGNCEKPIKTSCRFCEGKGYEFVTGFTVEGYETHEIAECTDCGGKPAATKEKGE